MLRIFPACWWYLTLAMLYLCFNFDDVAFVVHLMLLFVDTTLELSEPSLGVGYTRNVLHSCFLKVSKQRLSLQTGAGTILGPPNLKCWCDKVVAKNDPNSTQYPKYNTATIKRPISDYGERF